MNLGILPFVIALVLIVGLMTMLELGRRLGIRRLANDPDHAMAGTGILEGAVFGIISLFMAFTFSNASSRLDTRRAQITEEANSIGTAWLRLDALPAATQPQLRSEFKQYVDMRLAGYQKLPDIDGARETWARARILQDQIWKHAESACSLNPSVTMLVLPALNQMIDFAATRDTTILLHPLAIVFVMLGIMLLIGAALAGFGMSASKNRPWLHMIAFALALSITFYVILVLEFPRLGARMSAFDQPMIELRESMK